MRQVLQTRAGLTVVREVPDPPCPPGSVLVRTEFSLISSGTERARVAGAQKSLVQRARERPDLVRTVVARARREGLRQTGEAVRRKLSEELPIGYSCAGRVIEVGTVTRGISVGDLVSCAGVGHANHAEVVSVPANLCARVPKNVPAEAAAFTTVAAIALHGIRLGGVAVGDRVAVVGCGLVGQIACQLLHAAGAWVFATDTDKARVAEALGNGADAGCAVSEDPAGTLRFATDEIGADCVLVTAASPSSDPLLLAAEVARDRGTVILVGDVPVCVPRAPYYRKELAFRISRSYGPGRYDEEYEERGLDYPIGYVRWTEKRNMEAVLDLQSRGSIDLCRLIDGIVDVDHAAEAFERVLHGTLRGALLLAYGERPAPSAPEAPSIAVPSGGTVRVGLVGPGGFANAVIIPAFVSAGAELEAVAGGTGPSAEAAARRGQFRRVASSVEALLEDPDIDAVAICSRHADHAGTAAAALEAGKHVFCEKPLAIDLGQLDRVIASAARSDRVLAVGFNRRFSPLLTELRTIVEERRRGPVTAVYRVAAGRIASDSWVHDLRAGGGRAIGEGCHFVDSLAYLVGAPVIRVAAGGYGAPDLPVKARDNLIVTLWFEDGSLGSIVYVASTAEGLGKERLEVFAGDVTAVLDDYVRLTLFGPHTQPVRELRRPDKGHEAEIAAFVASVGSGVAPVPLAEVANVSLATIAIVESLRTALPVQIDGLELVPFTDDSE